MADKPPSAWLIEKALAAWKAGLEVYQDDDLWGAELGDAGYGTVPNVKDILHRLIQSAVNAGDMAVMAAQREAEIKQRKDRFLARERALREVVQGLMETMGEKSVQFGDVSASLSAGRDSVAITDASKLPPEYVKEVTTRTPIKADILADLKVGLVIDGAELANPKPTLVIRTK